MQTRRIEAFLVRLVVDEQPPVNPRLWRGRVQHVGTGSEHQFDNLDALLTYVNAHLFSAQQIDPAEGHQATALP